MITLKIYQKYFWTILIEVWYQNQGDDNPSCTLVSQVKYEGLYLVLSILSQEGIATLVPSRQEV